MMPISFCEIWPRVTKRAGATLLKASGPDNHDGTNRFEIIVYDTGFDGMGSALGAMRYDF
jgi:hypothetical protein